MSFWRLACVKVMASEWPLTLWWGILTGSWPRHILVKSLILSLNPGANASGSMATKQWPWNRTWRREKLFKELSQGVTVSTCIYCNYMFFYFSPKHNIPIAKFCLPVILNNSLNSMGHLRTFCVQLIWFLSEELKCWHKKYQFKQFTYFRKYIFTKL